MQIPKHKKIQLTGLSLFTYSQGKYFCLHDNGHDPVCDWIIKSKVIYEHYVLMMIAPILRECSYLVDVGCHVGTYTYAKQLTGNFNNTLSIDASQDNLELARINNNNRTNFESIHGFWIDESIGETHTMLSNEFKGKGHDKLHSNITNNPDGSFKIPNIKTNTIFDWIEKQHHNAKATTKPGFIKIDIDGSEVNTSKELCASLTCTKVPFIMLIETGNHKVIEELTELEVKILALLPGNNFLVCCQETFSDSNSLFCLHQTLALITGYLNKIARNDAYLRFTRTQLDGKSLTISSPFGELKSESSIINSHWAEHLSKYNIPMFCYG